MNIKQFIFSTLFLLTPALAFSEPTSFETFKGIVIDKNNNEPIIYASVFLPDYGSGSSTDSNGTFTIKINNFSATKNMAKISCIGYKTTTVSFLKNGKDIVVELTPDEKLLDEITVKKKKYQRKNNPAIDLIEKVIANKGENKKEGLDYFETEKYEKVQFAINNITPDYQKKKIFKNFQFIFENIDSLKNDGIKTLPVYLKENISTIYYQRSPKETKEIISARKAVSFAGFDNKGIEDNINYLYQDIDIYENNITFLTNQFLSPIAGIAPTFYKYEIIDTIQSGAEKYVKMYFGPHNKANMLFQGFLYIMLDGSFAVKKVELSVNKDININWINDVKIVQEYKKNSNNSWMLSSDLISINFGLTDKSRGLFGQKAVSYSDYKFDPSVPKNLLGGKNIEVVDSANLRSNAYWEERRHIKLSNSESGTYTAMDSIQNVTVFKNAMNIASIILFGYQDLGKFEIGPVNTFYMYNPIEGIRLRVGGRTTDKFSKKLNIETYAAYGFKDKKPKYYLGATWSLTERNFMEFPVKTIKMSYQNETQLPGQQMKFLMEDNILLSIKRGVNDKIFYNKTFTLEHLNEFENHFSYTLGYKFTKQTPGGNLYFNYTDFLSHTNNVNYLNISEFYLNLRYAPNEGFYQGKTYRVPIFNKYPIFEIRYNAGMKAWGNDYNYQTLRFNIRKRFHLSVLGYSDVIWEAGKTFGKVPYPLLNMPQANQSYSYQIESYNMMNFLEFVTDQYTSLMIDHSFNGFFFNKIPVMKKLNLREIVTCKILYGNVTKQNDPTEQSDLFRLPIETNGTRITYTLGETPYIEGSIGIGNIFKFFRVDFVKRFTYLDNPNVSKYGLRMRFKFDF